jgi:transcriptional regulator with XRE-family HTH domain
MQQPGVTFAVLLRRHRLMVGLSQEEPAERARISLNAIGSLERGVNRQPHPRTVVLLADALGLLGEPRAARSDPGERSSQPALASTGPPDRGEAAPILSNLPASSSSFVGRERDEARARSYYEQCLVASSRIAYLYHISFALEGLAGLAARASRPRRALRLIGAAIRLRHEARTPLPPMMQGRFDRTVELARQLMTPESANGAVAEGHGMTWQDASAYALTAEERK